MERNPSSMKQIVRINKNKGNFDFRRTPLSVGKTFSLTFQMEKNTRYGVLRIDEMLGLTKLNTHLFKKNLYELKNSPSFLRDIGKYSS